MIPGRNSNCQLEDSYYERAIGTAVIAKGAGVMLYNTTGETDFQDRLACIPKHRMVALTECGHNMHHDRPETIAGLIEEFFPL